MISKVTDKLWRGPHPNVIDVGILKNMGVTLCVDLQTAVDTISYSEDMETKAFLPIAELEGSPQWISDVESDAQSVQAYCASNPAPCEVCWS